MAEKYVIELEENPFIQNDDMDNPVSISTLRRVKGFNSLVFDEDGLSKLVKLEDIVKEIAEISFKKGYDSGRNTTKNSNQNAANSSSYLDGVHDMWKAVRRIILPKDCGCEDSLISEARVIFGGESVPGWQIRKIFMDYDPEVVLTKINEHDKKDDVSVPVVEVKIGDQVDLGDGNKGVVFSIDDNFARGYFYPESAVQPVPFSIPKTSVKLTGKHVDAIENMINNMR